MKCYLLKFFADYKISAYITLTKEIELPFAPYPGLSISMSDEEDGCQETKSVAWFHQIKAFQINLEDCLTTNFEIWEAWVKELIVDSGWKLDLVFESRAKTLEEAKQNQDGSSELPLKYVRVGEWIYGLTEIQLSFLRLDGRSFEIVGEEIRENLC